MVPPLLLLLLVLLLTSVCCCDCCRLSEFACANGHCVPSARFCDGNDDCGDLSDEPTACTSTYMHPPYSDFVPLMFLVQEAA